MSVLKVVLVLAGLACVQGRYAKPSGNSSVQVGSRYFYIPIGTPVPVTAAPVPVQPNPVQPNPVQPVPVQPVPVQTRAACPSTNSDNFHKSCLYQINSIRLTHNVPEVTYDDTLAAEAKKCADAFARSGSLTTPVCSYQNSGKTVGQNGATPAQACRAVVGDIDYGWYSEIPKGPLTWPGPTYAAGNQNIVQVLWNMTTKVGCALSDAFTTFPGASIPERALVCLWNPAGGTPATYAENVLEDTC